MPTSMSAANVLDRLRRGNQFFRTGEADLSVPWGKATFNAGLSDGQHPWAAVLTCSDSRVTSEHIFAADPGDLFPVRNAGNIASPVAVGSIEFAVEALGVPVVLVMRHTRCGAVTAAARGDRPESELLRGIVDAIADSGRRAGFTGPEHTEEIGRAHLARTLEQLREASASLRAAEEAGRVRIVPGMYDITTGWAHLDELV